MLDRFRLALSCLTGHAKEWAKLNFQPRVNISYAQLRETLELGFSDSNIKWILEKELYAKLQEEGEDSLIFIMRKLELTNLLKMHVIMRVKVKI